MLRIGLSGGIGSGKSTVAALFEVLGIPVYRADDASKRLLNEDPVLKESVIRHFGPECYSNGTLNRRYLAAQVFSDPAKLSALNALVHPATIRDAREWMNRQSAPYVLKEAALIFETGSDEDLDKVIGVYCPAAMRVRRVMERDGVTREEVISRMNRQISETIKMRLCDYVINNDGQQLLIPQVLELHQSLLELSKLPA